MNKKMTIDTLARMTQNEFSKIDERFDAVDKRFNGIDNTLQELKRGQKRLLEVVLELPSKKVIERLDDKVQSFDARLTSVERKVK